MQAKNENVLGTRVSVKFAICFKTLEDSNGMNYARLQTSILVCTASGTVMFQFSGFYCLSS